MLPNLISWQGIINLLWLMFLFALFCHFLQKWLLLNQARSWLITKGRVTEFTLQQEDNRVWPKILYTYQVFERDFEGEYFFLDTSLNNPNSRYAKQVAYRVAVAFKEDEEIEVFYNPDDPRQSALDIQIPKKLNFILIFIISLFLINVGTWLFCYLS